MQLSELKRCAHDVQRLMNVRDTSDRKARLLASAARVLANASGAVGEEIGPSETAIEDPGQFLWDLTLAVTTLGAAGGNFSSIDEAVAALQLASCTLSDSGAIVPERIERLRALDKDAITTIRPMTNGPYVLTHAATLTDWLGQDLIVPPTVALCRCGASTIKPFCDGTHVQQGFDDRKDPKRVQDRQDTYVGQQLTILDNRGTCAHSGFCTDRLPTVFHLAQEPFVTPSGGRLDEIVQV